MRIHPGPLALLACLALVACLEAGDLPSAGGPDAGPAEASGDGGFDAESLLPQDGGLEPSDASGDGARPVALTIRTHSLPAAEAEQAYAASIEGVGPNGAHTLSWQVSSPWLPPGIELGPMSGEHLTVSGTPMVAGEFSLTVTLSDGVSTEHADLTLSIAQAKRLQLPAVRLPPARVGEPYKGALPALNREGALSFEVSSGALPVGLSFEDKYGASAIIGTPQVAGRYELTISAVSSAQPGSPRMAVQRYLLEVRAEQAWFAASVRAETCLPTHARVIDATDTSSLPAARTFLHNKFACVSRLEFSPDAKWLYFAQDTNGPSSAAVVDLRGPADAALELVLLDALPSWKPGALWSPAGSMFAYWALDDQLSNTAVHFVDLRGEAPVDTELKGAFADDGAWSPDGRLLALRSVERDVIRVLALDGTLTDYPVESGGSANELFWSADSASIVYALQQAFESHLVRLELGSLARTQISPPTTSVAEYLLSRDGRRVVAADPDMRVVHVVDMSVSAPDVRSWHVESGSQLRAQEWSADSQHVLLFDRETRSYFTIDLATPKAARVATEKLVPKEFDELLWLRFMPWGDALLGGVGHGPQGFIPPTGGLYELKGGVSERLMATAAPPGEVQFAGGGVLVHEGVLLDLLKTPQIPVSYAGQPVVPTVDTQRARLYFRGNASNAEIVYGKQVAAPVTLLDFGPDTVTDMFFGFSP